MSLSAPLTPPDLDLRDFSYMPLDVVRLRDSDMTAIASGDGFRAAVLLWCAAWHQVPAASLPKDDRTLAHLAGFGRDLKSWMKVKADALRKFVECSDGRLYHPTIAEKAIEAADAKRKQRERTAAAREARLSKGSNSASDKSVTEPVTTPVTENVTSSKGREGKGRDSSLAASDEAAAATAPPPLDREDLRKRCVEAAGRDFDSGFGLIADLAEAGVSVETRIVPLIRNLAADLAKRRKKVTSWAWFAQAIGDEERATPSAPVVIDTVWCEIDSPEFAAGNRARAARGEPPFRGVPSRNHEGRGASFPRADIEPQGAPA